MKRLKAKQRARVAANVGLAFGAARDRAKSGDASILSNDELHSAAFLGLCNAGLKYDPKRGKFGNLAVTAIHHQINAERKSKRRKIQLMPTQTLIDDVRGTRDDIAGRLDYKEWYEGLNDLQRWIVDERIAGAPLGQIAAKLEMHVTRVVRLLEIMNVLRKGRAT